MRKNLIILFSFILSFLLILPFAYAQLNNYLKESDINGDGKVDIYDYTILLSNFGKSVNLTTPAPGNQYSASLTGAQEVPSVSTAATGNVTATLEGNTLTLSLQVMYLSSTQTAAHIHGPASSGQNAGVLYTLPNGDFTNHQVTLNNTQVQNLKDGLLYVNVHTQNHTGGEIRGQLLAADSSSNTPTPTHLVSAAVGKCGEPMDQWHPPVITQAYKDKLRTFYTSRNMIFPYESMTVGCATEHEHGDEPPSWISETACNWSGFKDTCNKYYVSYSGSLHGHPVSSSGQAENTYKHVSMKGFYVPLPAKGVEVYFRMHFSSTPFERNANYHSTEVWAKDIDGGVSHWQHWNYMGVGTGIGSANPGAGLCVRRNPPQPCDERRPGIFPTTDQGAVEGVGYEVWYSPEHASSVGGNWIWGMGLLIGDPVSRWTQAEGSGDGSATKATIDFTNPKDPLMDVTQWNLVDTNKGVIRAMDAIAWYRNSEYRRPDGSYGPITEKMGSVFWATQFGQIVSGPNDPICSQSHTAYDGKTYKNICLDQFIAPTMREVSFPGNIQQEKTYPSTGVKIPN